ncbi:hypothetical protein Tco_0918776, partial [Tanacetum coccineum]
FENEITQLANEYELRIGKKGYILDYIWEKCERVHGGTVILQYDQGFEEEEQLECCLENAYYDPPEFSVEIFEVKRYSFENGRGFFYVTNMLTDEMPLGRVNGARFKRMTRKKMDTAGSVQRAT